MSLLVINLSALEAIILAQKPRSWHAPLGSCPTNQHQLTHGEVLRCRLVLAGFNIL